MRNLRQHLSETSNNGSVRVNMVFVISLTIAWSVWMLIGNKPAQKAEENRSRAEEALNAAGFGRIGKEVYGRKQ